MATDFSKYGSPATQPITPVTSTLPSNAGGSNFSKYGTPVSTEMSAPISNTQLPSDTNANVATFPANANDTALSGSAKLIGNIPASAFNFGKGIISFLNPLTTAQTAANLGTSIGEAQNLGEQNAAVDKALGRQAPEGNLALETIKGIPQAAYQTLVPQFLQHIVSGDYQKAADTLRNDPVGQLAPLVLAARQAAYTKSTAAGEAFDAGISKIAAPVTVPTNYLTSKLANGVGTVASQMLGASTGAGASGIKEAFKGSDAFTQAMRGNVDAETLVNNVKDAVGQIAENRRNAYRTQLANIGEQTQSLDISPVLDEVHNQLKNFGIKVADDGSLDFSRSAIANSGSARADVQGVYDTLKQWGTQAGDRTPIGIDTLKKQLGDFYTESGSARAFVQAVKSKVSNILNTQVPGYSEMTKGYQNVSNLLDNIKSATGVGGKSKVDTIFSKLTNAMKQDNEMRLEVLNQVQAASGQPDIMAQIAGANMQTVMPKGLRGIGDAGAAVGVALHFISPQILLGLLSTSPRVMGEFVRALGLGAQKTTALLNAINQIPNTGLAPLNTMAEKAGVSAGLSIKKVGGEIPKTTSGEGVSAPKADMSGGFEGEYLYHGTNKTTLEAIKEQGIVPQRRGVSSFSTDESYSKNWSDNPWTKTEGVMFRVKKEALNGKLVEPKGERPATDKQFEVLTNQVVPPKDIEVFKDGKWQPLVSSPSIPKELQPLAAEARKYKSAEEFANAQSNKGNVVFRAQTGESGGGLKTSEYGTGTYFFGDYARAKEFAQSRNGEVVVAPPLKNPLVIDMEKTGVLGIKQKAIDAGLGGTPLKTKLSTAIDFLRDKGGYDGVRINHGDINGTPMSYEIYKSKPQTSQLTDFYNKVKGLKK